MNKVINNIFNSFLIPVESYQIEEVSDDQILLFKKAYKKFKEKNTETKAILILDLDTNTIVFNNFEALDMYKFGYEVAKAE